MLKDCLYCARALSLSKNIYFKLLSAYQNIPDFEYVLIERYISRFPFLFYPQNRYCHHIYKTSNYLSLLPLLNDNSAYKHYNYTIFLLISKCLCREIGALTINFFKRVAKIIFFALPIQMEKLAF